MQQTSKLLLMTMLRSRDRLDCDLLMLLHCTHGSIALDQVQVEVIADMPALPHEKWDEETKHKAKVPTQYPKHRPSGDDDGEF